MASNKPAPRPVTPGAVGQAFDAFAALDRARELASKESSAYSSKEDRQRWFEEQTPLWLHSLRREPNTIQPGTFRWSCQITENDQAGDMIFLTFTANAWRDSYFDKVDKILHALAGEPLGPLQLTQVPTKSANPAWDLVQWGTVREVVADDGLPF